MDKRNKIIKGITDIVTILAMIGCWVSTDSVKGQRGHFRNELEVADNFSWGTLHSIFSILFSFMILIHILQHWKLIKSIIVKNLYSKNVVSSVTFIAFLITIGSFLVYLTGFTNSKGEFHGTVANIFLIIGCIHLVLNLKKFLALFEGTLIKE